MNFLALFLDRLKIGTKLTLGMGVMLAMIIAMALQSVYGDHLQVKEIERMYAGELMGLSNLTQANSHLMETGRALRQMILAPDAPSRQLARAELDHARARLRYAMEASDKVLSRPEDRQRLLTIAALLKQYMLNIDHILALLQQDPGFKTDNVSRFLVSPDNVQVFEATDRMMETLVQDQQDAAKSAAQRAAEFSNELTRQTILILLVALTLALAVARLVGNAVRRPLDDLRQSIEDLAAGRLDQVVPHLEFSNEVGAMARSLDSLQRGARAAETQRWVKSQSVTIAMRLQSSRNLDEFAKALGQQLTAVIALQAGALYVLDQASGNYRFQSIGNQVQPHCGSMDFSAGEGLLGQCARDAACLVHQEQHLLPACNRSGTVLAVLEVSQIEPFSERQQLLLDELLPVIAMNLEILDRN